MLATPRFQLNASVPLEYEASTSTIEFSNAGLVSPLTLSSGQIRLDSDRTSFFTENIAFIDHTTNTYQSSAGQWIIADASTSGVVVSLPASPSNLDEVMLTCYSDNAFSFVIQGNSNNIFGSSSKQMKTRRTIIVKYSSTKGEWFVPYDCPDSSSPLLQGTYTVEEQNDYDLTFKGGRLTGFVNANS